MAKNIPLSIALYIRVSTEEQASNPEGSIKSQEQRLRQHVEFKNLDSNFGSITSIFIDRGKSGKNTTRPELQRLLKAIREKEINFVLVTELSRLSRSIKDFSEIWELMRTVGCGFQSLREQFDTTTAAGEMVLYTMANLAQFERKQTSERISANFKARAERGLSNGGSTPLGYRCDPEKRGYLFIVEDEAKIVETAFKTFLHEGSLSKAGVSLNSRGYRLPKRRENGNRRARLGHFTIDNLHDILKNPAYMGKRKAVINGQTTLVKAVWEPIVSEELFNRTQDLLKKNYRRHKSHSPERFPYQLSSLLFCKTCGDRLCGKTAHGRIGKVAYYEHSWSVRRQACLNKKIFFCKPNRILAKTVETHVWEKIQELLSQPRMAEYLITKAKEKHQNQAHITEQDRLRNKLSGILEQIEALAEHLSKIPKGISPTPIFDQMRKLESLKSETEKEIGVLSQSGVMIDEPSPLKDYQAYLSAISKMAELPDSALLKSKIIKLLIAKIELLPAGFRLHYFVGKGVFGSNSLTNGGSARARTVDLYHVKVAL